MTLYLTTAARYNGELVLGVLLIILLVFSVVSLCSLSWLSWFCQELRYINDEIKRNEGKEQQRWIKRKRRLLLSLIPFVRYR